MPPLKPRPSKLAKALQRVAAGKTVEPSHAPALNAGFNTIATEVQNMHLAISSQTFNALASVPGVNLPAAWVRSAHDAITHGVYSAVRHGGSAALSAAGVAERLMVDADSPPSKAQLLGRSALNGVFGDALAQAGNALAVRMSSHQHGRELTLTPESLADLRPRVAVFIHGLACDETSWQAQGGKRDSDYGSLLERELGMSNGAFRRMAHMDCKADSVAQPSDDRGRVTVTKSGIDARGFGHDGLLFSAMPETTPEPARSYCRFVSSAAAPFD